MNDFYFIFLFYFLIVVVVVDFLVLRNIFKTYRNLNIMVRVCLFLMREAERQIFGSV